MQRALLFAMSATLIGFTGCNKSSQEKASEKSAEVRQDADKAMQEVKENAQQAADKVEKEAKQAVGEIKENAADAREKIAKEAGKAGDQVRNSADKDDKTVRNDTRDDGRYTKGEAKADARQTNNDAKTEARQTNRDLHEALGMDQGKTAADKKLNDRIRAALKKDATAARDAGDVSLETRDGHVRIKGTVSSEEYKKAIASETRKVAGLTHVTDDIKVAERVGQP